MVTMMISTFFGSICIKIGYRIKLIWEIYFKSYFSNVFCYSIYEYTIKNLSQHIVLVRKEYNFESEDLFNKNKVCDRFQ